MNILKKNFFEKAQKNVILQAFQIGKKFVANPVFFTFYTIKIFLKKFLKKILRHKKLEKIEYFLFLSV